HFVGRKIADFILEDFSRWYMKLAKERFQQGLNEKDANYCIMHTISQMIKLMAPICPFITEKVYLEIFKAVEKKKSIHLCDFPKADTTKIDLALEEKMKIVDKVTEIVHAKRQENSIRLKWPIKKITLSGNESVKKTAKDLNTLLASLSNSKEVVFECLKLHIKAAPNYPILGPVFGKDVSKVVDLIKKENPENLKKALEKGKTTLGKYEITKDMVEIKESLPETLVGGGFEGGVVVVDISRTRELEEEALISELVRTVQVKRKEAGLKIQKTITLHIKGPKMLENWKEKIEEGTNSKVLFGGIKGETKESFEFEKEKLEFGF
ncbi:MAG: class I tRNA ligase family protein, partial [Candidatus Aenigmarchaeota archaeon]|nr:class I tRNA ligase family protein [Candidatus Aenigmarchaeota archaeon]